MPRCCPGSTSCWRSRRRCSRASPSSKAKQPASRRRRRPTRRCRHRAGTRPTPPRPRNKKRRKGRPGVARELCANPDETRDVYAERCACGTAVSPAGQTLAHAYDHIDLPPIKPVTTRINLHRAQCPCCKRRVTAQAARRHAAGQSVRAGHRLDRRLSARLPHGQLQSPRPRCSTACSA